MHGTGAGLIFLQLSPSMRKFRKIPIDDIMLLMLTAASNETVAAKPIAIEAGSYRPR
jgi:hypothetical protein